MVYIEYFFTTCKWSLVIFVLEPFFLVCFPPPMTYRVLTFRFSAAVQMKRMSQGFSMQIYVVVSDMFYFNLFFWKDDPIWLSFNWFEQRWNDEMINHKDTIRIIIGLAFISIIFHPNRSCRLRPELPRCRKCQPCPPQLHQRQVWMDQSGCQMTGT